MAGIVANIISQFNPAGVQQAEQSFGGLESKAKSTFGGLADFATSGAGAAAAAIGGFAVKAIGDFQDLALEVGSFSDATGLSTEAASRWIEVAGDIGVESNKIEAAVIKFSKAFETNAPAIEDFGIELVTLADGTVDMNASFANAITTIGKIPDPTKRAQAATELFGKSFGDLSELMVMDANELYDALDSVSDAKIIDDAEVKMARNFRDSLDELKGMAEDATLVFAQQMIPVIQDLATIALTGKEALDGLLGALPGGGGGGGIIGFINNANPFKFAVGGAADVIELLKDNTLAADNRFGRFFNTLEDGTSSSGGIGGLWNSIRDNVIPYIDQATEATADLEAAWQSLFDELDTETALLDIADQMDDLRAAGHEAFEAARTGSAEAEQKLRDYERQQIQVKERVLEYGEAIGALPKDVQTVLDLVEDGSIDQVNGILQGWARGVKVPVWVVPQGWSPGMPGLPPQANTRTTPAGSGSPANPVPPNGAGRPGGTPSVLINVAGSVLSDRDLIEKVREGLLTSQQSGRKVLL